MSGALLQKANLSVRRGALASQLVIPGFAIVGIGLLLDGHSPLKWLFAGLSLCLATLLIVDARRFGRVRFLPTGIVLKDGAFVPWISIVDVRSQRYIRYLNVSSGHTIQFGLLFAWSLDDIDAAIEEHRGRVAAGREST